MNLNERKLALQEFLLAKSREDESLPRARAVTWDECEKASGIAMGKPGRALVSRLREKIGAVSNPLRDESGRCIGFAFAASSTATAMLDNTIRRAGRAMMRIESDGKALRKVPGLSAADARQIDARTATVTMIRETIAGTLDAPKPSTVPLRLAKKPT
jgi:hypothetical protein